MIHAVLIETENSGLNARKIERFSLGENQLNRGSIGVS